MLNKKVTVCLITLAGAVFFAFFPTIGLASKPDVSTESATNISTNGATLRGSVDQNRLPTNVWFEYGRKKSLSDSIPVGAYFVNPGYNNDISVTISGLADDTTYYFRAVAQNMDGKDYGNIRSFTTNEFFVNYNYQIYPSYPTTSYYPLYLSATTEPANFTGETSVELNSLIQNEANNPSRAWFEWGTTPALGNKTAEVSTGTLPSVRHTNKMTGLSPGTIYYFRAVAENSTRRNNGSVLRFVTSGVKPTSPTYTTIIVSTDTVTETKAEKRVPIQT